MVVDASGYHRKRPRPLPAARIEGPDPRSRPWERPRRCPVRRVEGARLAVRKRSLSGCLLRPHYPLPGTRGRWADRRLGPRGSRARSRARSRFGSCCSRTRGPVRRYAPLTHTISPRFFPTYPSNTSSVRPERHAPLPPVVVRDPLRSETREVASCSASWMRICAAPKGARGSGAGTLLRRVHEEATGFHRSDAWTTSA